jgi:2-amino-4-hydroxy-6-hydroxymethyldihydropteridine diphosphokinase
MVAFGNSSAFIALGSNIEPCVRSIISALHLLHRSPGVDVDQVSSLFRSAAHTRDGSTQGDYLNAALRVTTTLDPWELLGRCLNIERALGRDRDHDRSWAPRTIDLDILVHSYGRVDAEHLVLPHPRMQERLFVLQPLAELVGPGHYFVEFDATMEDLLQSCSDKGTIVRTIVDLNNFK